MKESIGNKKLLDLTETMWFSFEKTYKTIIKSNFWVVENLLKKFGKIPIFGTNTRNYAYCIASITTKQTNVFKIAEKMIDLIYYTDT